MTNYRFLRLFLEVEGFPIMDPIQPALFSQQTLCQFLSMFCWHFSGLSREIFGINIFRQDRCLKRQFLFEVNLRIMLLDEMNKCLIKKAQGFYSLQNASCVNCLFFTFFSMQTSARSLFL